MGEVMIFFHSFYIDESKLFVDAVNNVTIPMKIYIFLPEGSESDSVFFSKINFIHTVSVFCVENRGRDISSFMNHLYLIPDNTNEKTRDLVFKLHSKRSQARWFKINLMSLIGSDKIIQENFNKLLAYPRSLIVHPLLNYPVFKIFELPSKIMCRLNSLIKFHNLKFLPVWSFPAGSMFAFSSDAKDIFFEIKNLFGSDFEDEAKYSDVSLAHLYERLFGYFFYLYGKGVHPTSLKGLLDLKAYFIKLL